MAPGTFEALPEPQSFERVLSSMCTEPHPVARQAAERFLATNPGDPASYPSVAELEERAVATLGDVVGLDEPHGYIASGGTEANIQAVRAARNLAATDTPNVVAPESAHFSFEKAASILGIELRLAPVDDDYRADPSALVELADQDTALIVGVAGTTEYGRVDPIPALAEVADDVDALFHVDAAYGAFLLPFTDHDWHFDHASVDTLTVDPHKMGQAAIPAGGFIVRHPAILDSLAVDPPYLESKSQVTLGGTRSGAGVASAAAVLRAQWPDGYEENYREAMANARWLAGEFEKRGMEVVGPELPIVVTTVSETVFDALREEGWRVARTAAGELRIVCMPHVTRERLRAFLEDFDAHQP